jgi:hypothetical protein
VPIAFELVSALPVRQVSFFSVQGEVVELAVSEFDESVEEGSDFEAGGVVIDGFYFGSAPFVGMILNYKRHRRSL